MSGNAIKFVFWNVKHKIENVALLLRYASENDVDIVAVCEAPSNIRGCDLFDFRYIQHIDEITNSEIQIFARGELGVKYNREERRFCLLRLFAENNSNNLNLAVVHLNSIISNNHRQAHQADISLLKNCIANIEEKNGKNTVIVGDFNENIFDESIVDFNGFNAKFFKFLMRNETVRIHAQVEELYYNPMLSVYNDNMQSDKGKGTYYYKDRSLMGWYCFDQVLLKYPLADKFNINRLKILDKLCSVSLVKDNVPVAAYSDHLPLAFEIEL